MGDRSDAARFGDEGFPCCAAGLDDLGVSIEEATRQIVLAKVLPDILWGIQFGAVGRGSRKRDRLSGTRNR